MRQISGMFLTFIQKGIQSEFQNANVLSDKLWLQLQKQYLSNGSQEIIYSLLAEYIWTNIDAACNHDHGRLDYNEGLWLPKAKSRLRFCLEVAESEDGDDAGDGDGEEAGGAGHHGPAGFRLCFGFRAFLLLSLNSFSFLQPVNVGFDGGTLA